MLNPVLIDKYTCTKHKLKETFKSTGSRQDIQKFSSMSGRVPCVWLLCKKNSKSGEELLWLA